MKKFFGGKKKKKTKAASFVGAESDYPVNDAVVPRKLKISHSTEQPRIPLSNNDTSLDVNSVGKSLMHSKSQGIIKTTIPTHQPANMAKRLNRPTSSPPALVMPRPRYAEPPTRAVLKSFDHEKTQLDTDHGGREQQQQKKQQRPTQQNHGNLGGGDNIIGKNENHTKEPLTALMRQPEPVLSISAPVPTKPRKVSPIPTHSQHSDVQSTTLLNKKSFDGAIALATAKKHESMNSITGSDDSNRVYESALESPMASTSTILDSHPTALGQSAHHHHSPTNATLVPSLLPPTTSDSSETVTPAGSTHQQYQRVLAPEQISIGSFSSIDIAKTAPQKPAITMVIPTQQHQQRPQPISPTRNHDDFIDSALQLPAEDLETLQQQVILIQQQREMDRLEYERMEQVHKERTKWMKAEIDRTQTKLLELTAQKRAQQSDNEGTSFSSHHHHHQQQQQQQQHQQQQQQQQQQHPDGFLRASSSHASSNGGSGDESSRRHQHPPSSASSTPSSRLHQKSKTSVSRSSSKTSTASTYRPKPDQYMDHPSNMDERILSQADFGGGSVSRQSSGRKSQQSQRQEHSTPRHQPPRQSRPRSKSTDERPPPEAYYDPSFYEEQQHRPPVRSRPRGRSHSVERSQPSFYPGPYIYPPPDMFEEAMATDDEDDDGDEDEINYGYPQPWFDSFPPPRQRMQPSYYQPPPYMRQRMPARMPPQGYYDFDPAYYPAPPPPIRRQQPVEEGYWPPFGRYPPMDDPRMAYWRPRGRLSPSEFAS